MTTEAVAKKTQFDTVEVYFHPPTIGDNPGCNLGPSIELDWKAYGESKLKLDTYEQTRPGKMQQRKSIYMSHYEESVCSGRQTTPIVTLLRLSSKRIQ